MWFLKRELPDVMNLYRAFILLIYSFFYTVFSFGSSSLPVIAFYHGGDGVIPDYARFAFEQACFYNPEVDIYLLVNDASKEKIKRWNLPQNFKFYKKSKRLKGAIDIQHLKFVKSKKRYTGSNLDWYCYERFFELKAFMSELKKDNVFFFEYDNLIYFNISDYIQIFEKEYKIGMTSMSESMIVCGFSYFKDLDSVSELCDFILRKWDLKLVDMAFWPFAKRFTSIIKDLPVIPTELMASQSLFNSNDVIYDNLFERFDSIFDAGPYGQYLCGAFGGLPGFVNDCSKYNPSKIEYVWEKDEKGKLAPFLIYRNWKLFNETN
jgi:hypothetical protein